MSSEDEELQDDRRYFFYKQNGDPELGTGSATVRKRRDIIRAVVRSDVDALRQLLDSPRWYRITDKRSLDLLQMSILCGKKEAFDYLLSLPNFPLEMIDIHRITPLIRAIFHGKSDYYAHELIKKGANVFYDGYAGCTTFSCAALMHNIPLAQLFMEKGVDLDSQDVKGDTALHLASRSYNKQSLVAIVSWLLYHGANPRIRNNRGYLPLEWAVTCRLEIIPHISIHKQIGAIEFETKKLLLETLFFYTYDKLSIDTMHASTFLNLAQYELPLDDEVYDLVIDEDIVEKLNYNLLSVDVKYLKLLLQKFPNILKEILPFCFHKRWPGEAVELEKLDVLLTSDLRDDMIYWVQNLQDDRLFRNLISHKMDESQVTNMFCYLLSYGLGVTENGLQRIYEKFGCCELFKILMHMDIRMNIRSVRDVMPCLFYDVTVDLESYLQDPVKFSSRNLNVLLYYFSNQKLVQYLSNTRNPFTIQEVIDCKIKTLPSVPLLVQLARDVFRKYFIARLQIKNSKEFYMHLSRLPIGNVYKKIVTFQKKLYP